MAGQNVRQYPVHHTHPCISDEAPDPLEVSQVTQSEFLPQTAARKSISMLLFGPCVMLDTYTSIHNMHRQASSMVILQKLTAH